MTTELIVLSRVSDSDSPNLKAFHKFHMDQAISDHAVRKSRQAVAMKLIAISFSKNGFNFFLLAWELRCI